MPKVKNCGIINKNHTIFCEILQKTFFDPEHIVKVTDINNFLKRQTKILIECSFII